MRLATLKLALTLALALSAAGPARSQGDFSPVMTVNGLAITGYELEQRMRFLDILGTEGDLRSLAETALIEDRLREYAAKRAGITISAETVQGGMSEFAGRANLSTEQFVEAIAQGGVDPETFRDFVSAGMLWRDVVRARFRGTISVSEAEVDRQLSVTEKRGAGPRVLLSEIVVPVRAGNTIVAQKTALDVAESLKSGTGFAEAARLHSAAPSRDNGGQIGWVPLTNLPPGVQQIVGGLRPGQISEPLQVPGGIAIFQVRGFEQGSGEVPPGSITVDYLTLSLPSAATANEVRASVRTCDDLYTAARSYPAAQLGQQVQPAGSVPGDIAGVLAGLDEDEAAVVTRGGVPVVVMLCSRTAFTAPGSEKAAREAAEAASNAQPYSEDGPPRIDADLGFGGGPSRDGVRSEVQNVRLALLAEKLLAELKANAVIVRTP